MPVWWAAGRMVECAPAVTTNRRTADASHRNKPKAAAESKHEAGRAVEIPSTSVGVRIFSDRQHAFRHPYGVTTDADAGKLAAVDRQ
jgi:hypothetical protein